MRLTAFVFLSMIAACSVAASSGNGAATTKPDASGGPRAPDSGVSAPRCEDVDLETDAENCGACGRSCHGGACSDGTCSAFEVHSADRDISSAVVHEGYVYFGY